MQNAADAEDCTEDVFVKAMSAEFNDEKRDSQSPPRISAVTD